MRARDEHDIDDDLRREDIDAKRTEARRRAAERGNDPWAGPFDASEMGEIAREAFNDCNDIDGPHWPTVGANILAALQEYRKCH